MLSKCQQIGKQVQERRELTGENKQNTELGFVHLPVSLPSQPRQRGP